MRDHLSVSQVQCYLLCPRKYRYRYLDELEPEFRSGAMAFGSAVHATLAWWFEERVAGREPELEDVQRVFRADWFAELASGELDLNGKSPVELQAMGEALVALFVEEMAEVVPEAVELRMEVPLLDPRTGEYLPLPLVGYLDFVVDGQVGEIKTTARKSKPTSWLFQLSAYAYALRVTRRRLPKARVVQLVKTKEPKMVVDDMDITELDVAWFLEVTAEVYDTIQAGAFFPNPGWLCPRCEYRSACRAWSRMAA